MAPTVAVGGASGFWGETTATIDWCERNYEVTAYVAEFWNSVSNLAMILPSILALASIGGQLERRYSICLVSLAMVGFGSFGFHATLLWEMQLFDELPMLWGSLVLLYCLFTLLYPALDRHPVGDWTVRACLFIYGSVVTLVYLFAQIPLLFQLSYSFPVLIMFYLDICVAKYLPSDIRLFYSAAIIYYTGFALWNIDNAFCDHLELIRRLVPVWLAPLTQLHALWHCLAGYGSYLHILFAAHARALSLGQSVAVELSWTGVQLVVSDPIGKKLA